MGQIFDIVFNDGQDEGADRILIPDGKLRALLNGRLTRDGRLEVRPQYTSLTNVSRTSPAERYYAYDLAAYESKLVAFGAVDSVSFTPEYSKDIYAYVGPASGSTLIQGAWKSSTNYGAVQYARLPYVSDLEILWTAPYGARMGNSDIAYTNGLIAACTTDPVTGICQVYVLRAADATAVTTTSIASVRSARIVASGTSFVLLTKTSGGDLNMQTFATATSSVIGFGGATTLVAAELADTFSWDASPLVGSSDFLVSYTRTAANAMRVRRYTVAGAVTWTFDVAATRQNSAVIGDTTNGVIFCYNSAAGNLIANTLNVATGVSSTGPTNILGPATGESACVGTPALAFIRADRFMAQIQTTASGPDSQFTIRLNAAHTLILTDRFDNTYIASKLFLNQRDSSNQMASAIGSIIVGGNTRGTDQTYATCIQSIQDGFLCEGRWNYGFSDPLIDAVATDYHGRSSVAAVGDNTFYACTGVQDEGQVGTLVAGTLQIVKFKSGKGGRRQVAEMQGALYIAGGFTGYYDGSPYLAESGFLDTPIIVSATPAAGGALTLLATYQYVAVYEWFDSKNRLHRSTPSAPFAATLTGGNQTFNVVTSSARSIRRADVVGNASVVRTVLYRNTNPAAGSASADSVFYRVADGATSTVLTDYANTLVIADTLSDTAAQVRPVWYIQSQKPTSNVAPLPNRFIAAGRDRLIYGGLPDPYMVAFSQLTFPGEPMEGASPNSFAYVARLPEPCTGVFAYGDSYGAFTADAIYQIPGAGPQRNGTGEFFYPQALFSDGGCIDWRSIVTCGQGTFFQLDLDKLYILTPGGDAQWIGQPIRDTLASYPVIVGSCLCTATQRVVFACQNTAANDGVLLIYDLRRSVWSVDPVGAVTAPTEYLGRLAYISGGIVFLEDATVGELGDVLPQFSARTGSLKLFKAGGQGDLMKIVVQGTYLGDCTLEGFISYDDGKTWTSMGTRAITTANLFNPVTGAALASGDPVTQVFTPHKRRVDRFSLRFDLTNPTNTGGMRIHIASLEVESDDFITRQPARNLR